MVLAVELSASLYEGDLYNQLRIPLPMGMFRMRNMHNSLVKLSYAKKELIAKRNRIMIRKHGEDRLESLLEESASSCQITASFCIFLTHSLDYLTFTSFKLKLMKDQLPCRFCYET